MDLERKPDGRLHFSLGPLEKWAAGLVGLAVGAVIWWMVDSVQTLLTQQAVTNQQLSTIVRQQADVPALRNDVTELKVRVGNLEDKTRELSRTGRAQ